MAYDSKDERSKNPRKVNRYSGVKEGPGIPMQHRKQSELGGKLSPGGRGVGRYDKRISVKAESTQVAKTPTEIKSLARSHTTAALTVLAAIMNKQDAPESARIAAAN